MNLKDFKRMVEYYRMIRKIYGDYHAMLVDPSGVLEYASTNKMTKVKWRNMMILYEEYRGYGLV